MNFGGSLEIASRREQWIDRTTGSPTMSNRIKDFEPQAALGRQLRAKSRRRRAEMVRASQVAAPPPRLNDLLPALTLESVRLSDLRPSATKVRRLDAVHVREVAASIARLGFCDPLLIGANGELIDGEIRYAAAEQLALERLPCIRVAHLNRDELRVLRLAVNRLAEKGQWDLDALKIEFEQLIVVDAPIEISGFEPAEIDHIVLGDEVDGLESGPLEPSPGALAVSRPGDVFMLGRHRIVCGDACDPGVVRRLMQDDAPARLLLTDEPYNVPIVGNVSRGAHREFAMASGEMSDAEYLAFNFAWMEAFTPVLANGAILATFIDWRGYSVVHAAATKSALAPLNLVIWTKTNAGMGSLYRSQHELLPLFKKGEAPHINNIQLGRKGRWRSNVWAYPGASSLGSEARRGLQNHPTVKPTAMLEDAMLDLTNRGDIVIDPFLGSGSTLIAAEAVGRVCRGVELDPLYLDVVIWRYEAVTGQATTLAETGESFESLAVRRAREAEAQPA
jgi:DNA modification methylase